jgi:hypothetical protein
MNIKFELGLNVSRSTQSAQTMKRIINYAKHLECKLQYYISLTSLPEDTVQQNSYYDLIARRSQMRALLVSLRTQVIWWLTVYTWSCTPTNLLRLGIAEFKYLITSVCLKYVHCLPLLLNSHKDITANGINVTQTQTMLIVSKIITNVVEVLSKSWFVSFICFCELSSVACKDCFMALISLFVY